MQRSPGGFPLTPTKDIMVNGKVLHLESAPPARISKLGAWTTEQLDLCAVCLVCESWDHVRRSINPAVLLLSWGGGLWPALALCVSSLLEKVIVI